MNKMFYDIFDLIAIDKIEEHGFSVEFIGNGEYEFGKYSNAGRDFRFTVNIGDSFTEFANNIVEEYYRFDVSEETYLWLDNTGHGKNGAPYDMKDVYEDTAQCRDFIYELYKIVKEMCV